MLIASLVIFEIVFFTVAIFIFRKVMNENVVSATKHLDELSVDYDQKEKKITHQMDEAKLKCKELLENAQEEAEKVKFDILKSAQEENDKIVAAARQQADEIIQQAEKSRHQLLQEVDDRIAKGSIAKACELLQEALPDELKRIAHDQWAKELIDDGFSQLDGVRVPENLQEAIVTTAFSLSDSQKENLEKKLSASLGRKVNLKEEVDPKVVAGLSIMIGSLVLDGTLRNKIKERVR